MIQAQFMSMETIPTLAIIYLILDNILKQITQY